jgi:protein TonB
MVQVVSVLARHLNQKGFKQFNLFIMIAKKNPGVDLERKRMVFFNIGLLTAGAFTLAAFTYSSPLLTVEEKSAVSSTEIEYLAEAQEKPKDEPVVTPKNEPQQPQQPAVGSQTAVSSAITTGANKTTGPKSGVGSTGPVGMKVPVVGNVAVRPEGIVLFPEKDASYVGGRPAMIGHMNDVQEYPEIDLQLGNQGKVYVTFVIEIDGRVTNVKTVRGLSETLDREAERIVRSFPKWKPGEDKFGAVRTRVRLPITFLLQ